MNSTATPTRVGSEQARYAEQYGYDRSYYADDAGHQEPARHYDRTQATARSAYPNGAAYANPPQEPGDTAGVDQTRYWIGASMTAAIVAIVALIGGVVAHGILGIRVLTDSSGQSQLLGYALGCVAIALAAAALFDLLIHVAPRPRTYFGALSGALMVLAGLVPFTMSGSLHAQTALAVMNVAVAATIAILVPIACSNARR